MNRRGIALVAALLALLIAGALASAGLAVAQWRWRAGLAQMAAARANARVRQTLERRLATWNPVWAESLTVGIDVALGGAAGSNFLQGDTVLRLGPALFQLRASAEEHDGAGGLAARDGATLIVSLAPPAFRDTAAIVSSAVSMNDGATVTGDDQVPAGWDSLCPSPDSSAIAVSVEADPLARFTPDIMSLLRSRSGTPIGGAIVSPAPVLDTDGSCDPVPLNWGDPGSGPCAGLFPVVTLQSGARVVDGIGAGVLLALGDVELSGDFSFTGVMLARGNVRLTGRARVLGVLVALGAVQLNDMTAINHSRCAVRRALGSQLVVPWRVQGGGWGLR